jgi:hypothetical protein
MLPHKSHNPGHADGVTRSSDRLVSMVFNKCDRRLRSFKLTNAGGEYDGKFHLYEGMGVLYDVIYNPDHWKRHCHPPSPTV